MLRFHDATSLHFRLILSEILSHSLWGSDVLLFSEFINIVFILFYNFFEFIVLLCASLVTFFVRYNDDMTCLISFSNFSDVLLDFICQRAIGNLWKICLEVNILRLEWSETFAWKSYTFNFYWKYSTVESLMLFYSFNL